MRCFWLFRCTREHVRDAAVGPSHVRRGSCSLLKVSLNAFWTPARSSRPSSFLLLLPLYSVHGPFSVSSTPLATPPATLDRYVFSTRHSEAVADARFTFQRNYMFGAMVGSASMLGGSNVYFLGDLYATNTPRRASLDSDVHVCAAHSWSLTIPTA